MSERIKVYIKRTQWFWTYTVLFAMLGLVIFGQFIVFDKSFVWTVDGFKQWYAILVDFKTWLMHFFSGNGLEFWKWNFGLGGDVIGNYSFMIFDPFSYICLFFDKENMDIAYSVICVLKLYASGIAMFVFLNYRFKNSRWNIIGALSYALSAWAFSSIYHEFFLTQLVIFPLIILGIDKIYKKESPAIFIISVTATILNSLYFTYMSAICAIIYMCVKYFCKSEQKSLKDFFVYVFLYFRYVLVCVLISSFALLPMLITLLNASKDAGVESELFLSGNQLLRVLEGFNADYSSNITIGYSEITLNALLIVAIPSIITNLKKKSELSFMALICFVFVLIPGFQLMLSGFSYPTMRWGYVFVFSFVAAGIEGIQDIGRLREKKYERIFIFMEIVFGIVGIWLWNGNVISAKDMAVIGISMILSVTIFFVINKANIKYEYWLVSFLALLSVCLLPYLKIKPYIGSRIDSYVTVGKSYECYEGLNLRVAEKLNKKEFARIDTVDSTDIDGKYVPMFHTATNANLYWNVPGINIYLSTIDARWIEYNKLLCNNSGCTGRVFIWNNDNRSRIDYLLGIRYFLGNDGKKPDREISKYASEGYKLAKEIDDVEIYKSKYNASLGYVYDNAVSETDFLKYDYLDREQILMQRAVMKDDEIDDVAIENNQNEIKIDKKKIDKKIQYSDTIEKKEQGFDVKSANSNLTISTDKRIKKSEVYVIFKNMQKKAYSVDELWELQNTGKEEDALAKTKFYKRYLNYKMEEGFSITVRKDSIVKLTSNWSGIAQAVVGVNDYCVNLGYFDEFTGEVVCTFSDIGHYTYDDIQIVAVPQDTFDTQAAKLEQNRFTVDTKENNYIAGNIDTENGGLLYLSVLYNDGWKIFLDGKQVEDVYLTDIAFTGIEVPAGKHRVELKYRPVGYPYTLICSVIGIIIFITIIVLYEKRKRR